MMSSTPTIIEPTNLSVGEPVKLGPVKLTKIQQKESGPFTTRNNLCSIEIDSENVTDLKKSYLDLHVKFQALNGDPAVSVKIGDKDQDARYMGSSFFKTVTMKSENVGLVEQMRFQNVYSETMKQFHKYTQEEDSANLLNNGGDVLVDADGFAHIIVPVKDVLPGCGNSEMPYPNNRMGPSILELELENVLPLAHSTVDGLEASYDVGCEDVPEEEDDFEFNEITLSLRSNSQEEAELFFMRGERNPTLTYTLNAVVTGVEVVLTSATVNPVGGVTTLTFRQPNNDPIIIPANEGLTDITLQLNVPGSKPGDDVEGESGDLDVDALTFTAETDDFIIGEVLFVSYLFETAAGALPTDVYHVAQGVVTDVEVDATDPTKVIVTFEDTIFTIPGGFDAVQIHSFANLEPTDLKWSISQIDLVLVKPIMPFQVPVYEIKCMNLEMVNLPQGVPFFRRQFELEQSCDLVLVMNPINTLISTYQFTSYRNAINSVQTTTHDVEIQPYSNSSLYYDRLLTAMDDLKRLQFRNGEIRVGIIAEAITPQVSGLPNNVLLIELMNPVAGGAVSSMIYCFKRIMRVF